MADAGWYPDPSSPSSAPRLRYWDGQAWTEQTSVPPAAPPTRATSWPTASDRPGTWPTAPAPAGAPGPESGGAGKGRLIGLVLLAVLLVAALTVGGIVGVRALSDDSGDGAGPASGGSSESTQTDDTAEPSPGTDDPSSATPSPSTSTEPGEVCEAGAPLEREPHPSDGRLHGGGLSMPAPDGYRRDDYEFTYTFADDAVTVVTDLAGDYVATYALARLEKGDGFTSVQLAAQQVALCITDSDDFYPPEATRRLRESEATDVAGQDAWSARVQMRIPDVEIAGGDIQAVVVDTGDPDSYGLFVAIMPIGDQRLLLQREQVLGGLTLD